MQELIDTETEHLSILKTVAVSDPFMAGRFMSLTRPHSVGRRVVYVGRLRVYGTLSRVFPG